MQPVLVQNDFLDGKSFQAIEAVMLDPKFDWHFMDGKMRDRDGEQTTGLTPEQTNFKLASFTHIFYNQITHKTSPFFDVLVPLLNKLKSETGGPKAIIRIKGNLMINTGQGVVEHGMHEDYEYDHKGAIFSINTCNGYTKIGDKKIMSEKNQLILFNPHEKHTGSTTSNANFRCNLIINYF